MRLFFVLVLLQTLMLPTRSAFPSPFAAYRWHEARGDAFYRGTVTLPDGTRYEFQTRDNRLWFPSGSKVRVTAYAKPARALGPRKVNREDMETRAAASAGDDEADRAEYGSVDAVIGSPEEAATATKEPGSASAGDLCAAIQASARLYVGEESIAAKGGLSDFKGDSMIVGTLIDWACSLSKTWVWGGQISRHDMRLLQKETTPNGTSERTRSYDRTSATLAALRRHQDTAVLYGLGLSYARLPLLKITQPGLNASQLKQQGFGAVSLLGRYAPPEGWQASFTLSPYALDSRSFLAYALEMGWRSTFRDQWHWDVGGRYDAVHVTIDSSCRDNPFCRKAATTDLTLPQAWVGMGKDF